MNITILGLTQRILSLKGYFWIPETVPSTAEKCPDMIRSHMESDENI